MSRLGESLVGLNRFEEAEPLLLDGSRGMFEHKEKIPPRSREGLSNSIERIIALYEAWHLNSPSKSYDAEATKWRKTLTSYKEMELEPHSDPKDPDYEGIN